MTQDQVIILLFRIVLIAGLASIVLFIGEYTWRAPWWRNPIGRTLIIKDILLVFLLLPSTLSLFFNFSRLTSHIAAWVDIVLFGLLTPVMCWRIVVWERLHREKSNGAPGNGGSGQ